MPSPFARLLTSVVQPAVDSVFADDEGFDFRPMAQSGGGVNGRPGPDTNRAVALAVPAIWYSRPMEIAEPKDRPGFATTEPQIAVRAWLVPWAIQRGDEIKRLATGEVFRVAEVEPDGHGRVNLRVTLLGVEEDAP